MGKGKDKIKKKANVARIIDKQKDTRVSVNKSSLVRQKELRDGKGKKEEKDTFEGRNIHRHQTANSAMFFSYNTSLGPPYRILIDTNFINFSIQNKLDIFTSLMDCLLAKCIPIITDCVMAELEKLGSRYHVALRIAKDPRFERYPCSHKGTYADDCICNRVTQHKCYIVATCDRDLKRRIRKIPGVPIMYISQRRFSIERFPDTNDAPST